MPKEVLNKRNGQHYDKNPTKSYGSLQTSSSAIDFNDGIIQNIKHVRDHFGKQAENEFYKLSELKGEFIQTKMSFVNHLDTSISLLTKAVELRKNQLPQFIDEWPITANDESVSSTNITNLLDKISKLK